jgi:hypothetical protein
MVEIMNTIRVAQTTYGLFAAAIDYLIIWVI